MSTVKEPSKAATSLGAKIYQYCRLGCWYMWFFFLFTIHEDSYLNKPYLPNINRNYNQKLNINALSRCLLLLLLFGLHHSIFIRQSVKQYLFNTFSLTPERQLEIYAFTSIGFLYVIPIFWSYSFNNIGGGIIWNLFDAYIIINNLILIAMIKLFFYVLKDLEQFGIIQSEKVIMKGCYGIVRHPAQACILGMMWFTPFMTVSRFIFSITLTIYIIIGLYFEENDLIKKFGDSYIVYKQNVPAFIPYRLLKT
eukprot:132377_1